MANPASSAPRNPESGSAANPAATPSPTQRPTVDLTALTNRDDFLLELGEALGGQASVSPVESIDSAIGQLSSSRRGQMLVIDARATSDLRSDVHRALQQAPNAVVVVFAEADAEKQVASAVKGTSVFAVLTIPIGGPKTVAVLDAAIADAGNRSAGTRAAGAERPGAPGAAGTVTLDAFRPSLAAAATEPQEPADGGGQRGLWVAAGIAAVAVAAGGAWFFMHGKAAPLPEATSGSAARLAPHPGAAPSGAAVLPQPVVDTSIVAGHVDDLLEKARRAMRDRRYTAPTGDNALVFYRSALAADPTSGEAKDGLRRVGDVCISRFNDALSGGRYDEAALALATLKLAEPSDPHLAAFQQQLMSAQIAQALAGGRANRAAALLREARQSKAVPAAQLAAWRSQLEHLQQADRTQSLAALVHARIESDELTSPAGDSAAAYLSQLRAVAPSAPATEQAANALTAAFFSKAREQALAGDAAGESRWLAAARANGASTAAISQFQRQLAGAQIKAAHLRSDRLLSLIRDRLESGALTSPAGDSAADYLHQLEASHPTGSAREAAAGERSTLAAKLVARARTEMSEGETDPAEADLAAARSWGASEAELATVQRQSTAPSANAQPAVASGPDLAALAAQLKRIRYVPPQYPDSALSDRVSGSVTVQYVVDKRGYTKDIKVTQSVPPGVFDRAAMDAIRQWRYRAARYHGQPVEVPVRTLIRFVLPN